MSGAAPPIGLITVRLGSSRLQRKCLLEFGEGNVLEHVIRRTAAAGFAPLVCTTENPEDDAIVAIAEAARCLVYRGSEKDKLMRWRDACRAHGVTAFHTIDADDPFLSGMLARASMRLLHEGSYDLVAPSETSYLASVGYSLTADIIDRACALKTTDDTEMMWYHVEKVPGLRAATLQTPDARIRDVRLTLDYEEDYWLLRTVLRVLGPHAEMPAIEDLFLRNPQLTEVNWFRNAAWKAGQEAKRV